MTRIHIPDNILQHAGITESDARIELATRLFDTGKLSLFLAAQLAGMPQPDFEDHLLRQNIPLYRYTPGDLRNDLETLRSSGAR